MDIQFIQYLDLVPIRQVIPIKDAPMPTLELHGSDFRKVSSVRMNGVDSPSVVVLSQTTLWAQVPDVFIGQKVSSIEVFSSGLILTERTRLVFSLESHKKVTGFEKLIQLFVKLLLQTPGRSSYDPVGGGLLAVIGQNFNDDQNKSIESFIISAVDRITTRIRDRQGADPRIPIQERLLSAKVTEIRARSTSGEIHAKIEIRNMAGQTGIAAVSGPTEELAA